MECFNGTKRGHFFKMSERAKTEVCNYSTILQYEEIFVSLHRCVILDDTLQVPCFILYSKANHYFIH